MTVDSDFSSKQGTSVHDRSTPPLSYRGLIAEIERFRIALVDQAAKRCVDAGWTTIALFGAGQHTRRYLRQPWRWRGVRVSAVLDDQPQFESIEGVPVVKPAQLPGGIDAVVISSDAHESLLYKRATRALDGRVPILRIYGEQPPLAESDTASIVDRLQSAGIASHDARWLTENRAERHDACVDSLPIQRTELHLRRYELARPFAAEAQAVDAACGTGYGAEILANAGAKRVTAIDLDQQAVAYAEKYHSHPAVHYHRGDVVSSPLPDASVSLVTSFETIEHLQTPADLIAEFARILQPGGTLVLSTPNDLGTTDFHEVSLTQDDLDRMLAPSFDIIERLGQIPGNDPIDGQRPPGIFRQGQFELRPDTLIVIAKRRADEQS